MLNDVFGQRGRLNSTAAPLLYRDTATLCALDYIVYVLHALGLGLYGTSEVDCLEPRRRGALTCFLGLGLSLVAVQHGGCAATHPAYII